jgi:DNA-binding CsgD family transcriptional regulator
MEVSDASTVFLAAFFAQHKPIALFQNHTDINDKVALKLYLDVAHVLDPFYRLFKTESSDQIAKLSEIAPDDFKQSEYYERFYAGMRLSDECGVMVRISDDAALFLSLGIQSPGKATRPDKLEAMLPLIAALVRRHWTTLSPEQTDGSGRLAAHLKSAFEAFGTSVLSPREADIVQMILLGHSSKAIARVFGNSPETIKVHRKRMYAKLNVTSQGELLSLLLTSLEQFPPNATGDPLAFIVRP